MESNYIAWHLPSARWAKKSADGNLDSPDGYATGASLHTTHSVQLRPFEPGMISRALRLMKDVSVADAEVWQGAGRSDSGARGNEFYRFASACVQRNGA
jgi:hypothetical protein